MKIGLRGVRTDPYGSVWIRMVPGDLFQGLGFLEVWGMGGVPLILIYMALWAALLGLCRPL